MKTQLLCKKTIFIFNFKVGPKLNLKKFMGFLIKKNKINKITEKKNYFNVENHFFLDKNFKIFTESRESCQSVNPSGTAGSTSTSARQFR